MEIVCILEDKLYSMYYDEKNQHEYDTLMELWGDTAYLYEYGKNEGFSSKRLRSFVKSVQRDLEAIEDLMVKVKEDEEHLASFFQNLDDMTTGFGELTLQKGKVRRRTYLRLYGIRIDDETYLITGGAIKIHHKMNEHEDTREELRKMNKVKEYLQEKGVFDEDSFDDYRNS